MPHTQRLNSEREWERKFVAVIPEETAAGDAPAGHVQILAEIREGGVSRSCPALSNYTEENSMRERVLTRKLESRTTTDVSQDHPREVQPYGTVVSVPTALDAAVRGTRSSLLVMAQMSR